MKQVAFKVLLLGLVVSVGYAQPEPNALNGVKEGILHLPPAVSVCLVDTDGLTLDVEPSDGTAHLPVGSYQLRHWVYQKTDAEGNLWKLKCDEGFIKTLCIGPEPTSLKINPEPIEASLSVHAGETYLFYIFLSAPAGEDLYVYQQEQARAPSLVITNHDNSYSVTLTGEYG